MKISSEKLPDLQYSSYMVILMLSPSVKHHIPTMASYASRPPRDPAHYFQYPSPTSNTFTDSAIGSEVIDDTKGRLFSRWNEILSRITHTSLADKTVTAMHKNLDVIDNLLSWDATEEEGETDKASGLGISEFKTDDSVYTMAHMTPTASIAPDAPEAMCRSESKEEALVGSQALLVRVTEAVDQLRRREEEFRVSGAHWRKRRPCIA